jgi:hypothetical protein
VGVRVGVRVGVGVRVAVGVALGAVVGVFDGVALGPAVGELVGVAVGAGGAGLRMTIVVPLLSPSGSWLAAAVYANPERVTLMTVNVTDAADAGACDPSTEQVPAEFVTHEVWPEEPPL